MTQLAEAAVGFDSGRGDQVSVEDMAFEGNTAHSPATPMQQFLSGAAQSEALWKYAALLLALGCLVFFVIRPAMRKPALLGAAAEATLQTEPQLTLGEDASEQRAVEEDEREHKKMRAQLVFDTVAEHLRRDPAQATRLLQIWIHTE